MMRLKKDGTPDMRCREARATLPAGQNVNGSPDMRLKQNRKELPAGRNVDGTPDRRLRENRTIEEPFVPRVEKAWSVSRPSSIPAPKAHPSPATQGGFVNRRAPLRKPQLQPNEAPPDGRTFTMFHGTSIENAESIKQSGFRPSKNGLLGPGVYLSREFKKAKRYANRHSNGGVVLLVHADLGRVLKIDTQNMSSCKAWHSMGYDTAWVPPNTPGWLSNLEEDCVHDPRRVTFLEVVWDNGAAFSEVEASGGKRDAMQSHPMVSEIAPVNLFQAPASKSASPHTQTASFGHPHHDVSSQAASSGWGQVPASGQHAIAGMFRVGGMRVCADHLATSNPRSEPAHFMSTGGFGAVDSRMTSAAQRDGGPAIGFESAQALNQYGASVDHFSQQQLAYANYVATQKQREEEERSLRAEKEREEEEERRKLEEEETVRMRKERARKAQEVIEKWREREKLEEERKRRRQKEQDEENTRLREPKQLALHRARYVSVREKKLAALQERSAARTRERPLETQTRRESADADRDGGDRELQMSTHDRDEQRGLEGQKHEEPVRQRKTMTQTFEQLEAMLAVWAVMGMRTVEVLVLTAGWLVTDTKWLCRQLWTCASTAMDFRVEFRVVCSSIRHRITALISRDSTKAKPVPQKRRRRRDAGNCERQGQRGTGGKGEQATARGCEKMPARLAGAWQACTRLRITACMLWAHPRIEEWITWLLKVRVGAILALGVLLCCMMHLDPCCSCGLSHVEARKHELQASLEQSGQECDPHCGSDCCQ